MLITFHCHIPFKVLMSPLVHFLSPCLRFPLICSSFSLPLSSLCFVPVLALSSLRSSLHLSLSSSSPPVCVSMPRSTLTTMQSSVRKPSLRWMTCRRATPLRRKQPSGTLNTLDWMETLPALVSGACSNGKNLHHVSTPSLELGWRVYLQ